MNSIPSIRQNSLGAAVAFIVVLMVGYLADVVLFRHPSWMLVDEVILAVAAGLVVFRYERERSRFLAEKLRVIREMTLLCETNCKFFMPPRSIPTRRA
jgi:hypothetical protein